MFAVLSDAKARTAKGAEKPYKLTDAGGLHLYVTPAGGKLWRWRYRINGREKLLSLGRYPEITLSEARRLRDLAEASRAAGTDPGETKRLRKLAGVLDRGNSFEAIARAWYEKQKPRWTARHASDVLTSLEWAFLDIGSMPIREVTVPIVLSVLRGVEARPAIETAHRLRQRMSAVFVYAISSGLGVHDPAAIVKGALSPIIKGRQPSMTSLDDARQMLADTETCPGHPVTKLAIRFLALTAMRPGEVRAAQWSEFENLDGRQPIWRVPAERMKMRREHLVPLAPQAVEVLKALRRLGIRGDLAFPSGRNWQKPLSENAMGYLINRAGYHGRHVPHGWRATFSTIMNERQHPDRAVIDLMLAHAPANAVEGAYNRAAHLDRRRQLARIWAGLLLKDALPAADLLETVRRAVPAGRAVA